MDINICQSVEDLPAMPSAQLCDLWPPPTDWEVHDAEQALRFVDTTSAAASFLELLQRGTPVHKLQDCLHAAVKLQADELVHQMLSAGVPFNMLIIKTAIQQKALPILSLLKRYGWDINQEEAWCIPPWLSFALKTNPDIELLDWFLGNGVDPDKACQIGTTPLSTAAANASLDVIRKVFSSCPSPTSLRGHLLHFAVRRSDAEADAVVLLILNSVQPHINARMWEDCPLAYECFKLTGLGTALHETAKAGSVAVAEILLRHGADISIQDSCGRTAREVAELYGNQPVLDLLRDVEKGHLPVIRVAHDEAAARYR
ncbi:hypothetical protein LTR29_016859 [Friedmanniomyces endolithicus]|nr:hypothetical protein LTR29_016859 [Friedmanniomyces endolithicus]